MSALEKSKGRVELLDELAAKLNEAISIKEAQLVRNVASDLDINGDDAGDLVRIVSPTQDNGTILDNESHTTFNRSEFSEDQELSLDIEREGDISSYSQAEEVPGSFSSENEANMLSSFGGPSSYIDFLEDLDQQLNNIESDLALVLVNEEIPNNTKVQQLKILENIRSARGRIRNYVKEITATR
ncbi:uncharacterized protein LOC110691921 isoform X2 [Chenopodium quinoa]|nr:uncharacterized protein LOC110691921 isoform X2 [Chenopodium quinoa]XP_021724597.1 uncharacterized protein LOC110691921 isoform X2 [Chenopodium quinoa]